MCLNQMISGEDMVSPLKSECLNERKGVSMDILDFLTNNKVYAPYIILAGAIVLLILYMTASLVYYALFPSKRTWRTKSFDDEAEEYRNKPISGSESIGSIGTRLGEDVRDVWGMGYSDEQINDVLTGRYTLDEMYKMGPEGNTKSPKGQEILDNKKRSM